MDEKTLKVLAMKSMSAMLMVVLFSVVLTQYNNITIYANESLAEVSEDSNLYRKSLESVSTEELKRQEKQLEEKNQIRKIESADVDKIVGHSYIKLAKPSEDTLKIAWEDLYMTRQVRVRMVGLEEKWITKKSLSCEGTLEEAFEDVLISYEYDPNTFLYTAVVDIKLNNIYIQQVYEDEENVYITLQEPRSVYDKIIVVDAGHGGNDIGTYTDDMEYYEKDINLSIVLYLKELLDKEKNIKVYYTRLSDEKVYLNPRLDLANDLKADLFISVHCNSSDYTSAKGSEVLYSTKHQKNLALKSDKLAKLCLDELIKIVKTKNRGTVNGNDIYIVANSKVPVALIEVGFMSNSTDMKFLKYEKNRKKTATGIYNGIMKACEQLETTKKGMNYGE